MAIGMGKPTVKRSTAAVSRIRIKTHLRTEGIGPTIECKTKSPRMVRSGRGYFAAYHQRFSHEEEDDWRCSCGKYRAPLHPFGCTNARVHRALLWSEKTKRALSTEEILSTLEGAAAFAKWALETGLFSRRFGVRERGEQDP